MGKKGGIGKGRRQGQGRFHLWEAFDGFDGENQVYDGLIQILKGYFKVLTAAELVSQSQSQLSN